jgi:hypothetical protein
MAFPMLAACLSFIISVQSHARIAVIAFFMFVFIFFYSWGQALGMSAETEPNVVQKTGR